MSAKQIVMAAAGASGPVNYIEDVFSTYLYTGNGSTQTITNGIDLAGKGGLVWIKRRDTTSNHFLTNTTNTPGDGLRSNTTDALETGRGFTSFNSNGFSLSADAVLNGSAGSTYASWTFRKQPKFFDVVTWTKGTNTNNRISHALGSTPGCIIIKSITNGSQWFVWHRTFSNPLRDYLSLNASVGVSTAGADFWGASAPTATDFGINDSVFGSAGEQWVAYLFAHDAGGFGLTGTDNVISCGSFSGSGSVTLGWEPQFVLWKLASGGAGSGDWNLYDTMRGFTASNSARWLQANTFNAESDNGGLSITSTGFSFGGIGTATYIYLAIRRGPMKTPTTGTSVYAAVSYTGDSQSGVDRIVGYNGFPLDMMMIRNRNGVAIANYGSGVVDRLRGLPTTNQVASGSITPTASLSTFSTESESNLAGLTGFVQDRVGVQANSGYLNFSGVTYIGHCFRRAPGFFDVVCYTGTGSNTTQTHNLGVAPELMIIKSRGTSSTNWAVYSRFTSTTYGYQTLQTDNAGSSNRTYGPGGSPNFEELSAAPTASVINLASSAESNFSGRTFVAYLFASCPGVSKVGSYTGNGSSQTINCGFTGGAQFVLIKRTDSTGDWYVWDTARGIVAADDPHLSLNSTAAEVTTNDSIDPDNSGFIVNQVAATNINVSSATYIYLAIA